jgi:hypothetical protein
MLEYRPRDHPGSNRKRDAVVADGAVPQCADNDEG